MPRVEKGGGQAWWVREEERRPVERHHSCLRWSGRILGEYNGRINEAVDVEKAMLGLDIFISFFAYDICVLFSSFS